MFYHLATMHLWCLKSFSWTVDSRTSRNGLNWWSKKEFSGDNARCRSGRDSRFTRGGSQCLVRLPRKQVKLRLTRTAMSIVLMLDLLNGIEIRLHEAREVSVS